ncbi:uncharacterized protein Nmag_4066 (plasmid) [Natrialba magadii ATCC 43099]|uniref:Uncharacterized protein n=1 Tax=Natrialba magadii (strain ATCC 43099 / DSM 3394 / CCM 3739 / CIP 104546 / IAM 13178 / JCM 8861 / NBRC 102185 / NCIMB 2190 / MS3) TaxID=547559 RepID=D3T1Y3_NATMM|nr:uncharacterized protein Nmag_4066 [Natrialba magadii ATCC 43099]
MGDSTPISGDRVFGFISIKNNLFTALSEYSQPSVNMDLQ